MLVEDIKIELEKIQRDLISKGAVFFLNNQKMVGNPWYLILVGTCAYSQKSLIIQTNNYSTNTFTNCIINFSDGWIVEHLQIGDTHRLCAIQNYQTFLSLLIPVDLDKIPKLDIPSFSLKEKDLFQSIKCIPDQIQEGNAILLASGINSKIVSLLVSTFEKPIINGSFVLLSQEDNNAYQIQGGLSFLVGSDLMWIMRPYQEDGEDRVLFEPASANLIRQRFLNLLPINDVDP
jgi:hypothetical protein